MSNDSYQLAPTLWAHNADTALITPTFDESGEAVHPDVYYNADGWNGFKYWMAMTPYTGTDNSVESPSILASNDGLTWVVPDGLTNPVVAGQNSDTDLSVDENGTMYLVYRANTDPITPTKYCKSTNGIVWSSPVTMYEDNYGGELSPSLVYINNQWLCFTISRLTTPRQIERRMILDIEGQWTSPTACNISELPYGEDLWHLDVIKNGSRLLALINTDAGRLVYAYSDDFGINWNVDKMIFLRQSGSGWDNTRIYRATFLKDGDTFKIWYSGQSSLNVWGVGFTTGHIVRPERT